MYGSEYNNGLARELRCEVNDDGTVAVDDHGRTSAEDVYAVGDLTPGHNQCRWCWPKERKPVSLCTSHCGTSRPTPTSSRRRGRSEEVSVIPDELLEQVVEFHTYD